MALTSPGVEVTITDESQYLPSATSSVPLVVIATSQNKANASRTGIAQGTTAANAGKLYQVTSQRDLVNLYGQPFFYTTANGTPLQGYELNEYGLLAAYSLLGVTNRCYVLRANIDLASLVGTTSRPVGEPDDNTWWLDTTTSTWGIYQFNATTGKFVLQTPIVITDTDFLSSGVPITSVGNIGDYAVVAIPNYNIPSSNQKTYFYKTTANQWVGLGGSAWRLDVPTVTGANTNPTLTAGDTFTIDGSGFWSTTITVPAGPNNTIAGVAAAINALGYATLAAEVRNGRLCVFSNQNLVASTTPPYLEFTTGVGTALADIGITAGYEYNQSLVEYGTSAQMPLWTSSQTYPRPTGSVWIKVGAAGVGLNPIVANYDTVTNNWINKNVTLGLSDWAVNADIDSSGGLAIPAKSVYAQYHFNGQATNVPVYYWERVATGPTVVTGSVTGFNLTGPRTVYVQVSEPGVDVLSSTYTVTLPNNCDPTDFVTAWSAANVPYTTASVTTDDAVQLTHTAGGVIIMNDFDPVTGVSNNAIVDSGFVIGTTDGVKYGPGVVRDFTGAASTALSGPGTGCTINVRAILGLYRLNGDGVQAGGSGYSVGNQLKVLGTALGGATPANDLTVEVTNVSAGAVTAVTLVSGTPSTAMSAQLSNWREFTMTANEGAPTVAPANDTNWFFSVTNQVDIMVQKNGSWIGYKNTNYDLNGFPSATGTNTTDPNGPIFSATAPTLQSDGTALAYGDLWIDSNDLENYPVISRWQNVNGSDQWVLIDNTDQTTSSGILFADARWAPSGTVNPADDPIPTIVSLLTSNYLDLDAPEPTLYPSGTLLFNTRRSGYNVKQYRVNYFNSTSYPPPAVLPTSTDAWVTISGNQADGAMYAGRKAQRAVVVNALRQVVATNTAIRDEDNFFNLIATPNYPELQSTMIELNSARGETGYIIGDTPLGLPDSATDIQAWANNDAGAQSTGEQGLVTRNTYMGLFYPSGLTTDPRTGNLVAVPPSHMMLYTFLKNDTIAYPWFAAAGTKRGLVYNAAQIGYVNRETGEFITTKTRLGLRDTLYVNFINPITFFSGVGLLNYGNKTSYNSQSALDRTNVARLIAYLRRQLTIAARPFVFEPNDGLTRAQIAGVIQTLLVDLVAKRGIYDYYVQCDEQNNPPAVVDRNELYVNVAVEPVKAAEFIYIPVRVLNTGEISQG